MQEPLVSVPASIAAAYSASRLIVRVESASDASYVAGIPRERIAWVQTCLALADFAWPEEIALDIVLSDPVHEARRLYALARLYEGSLPRLTIPSLPGAAAAAKLAIALHFPVRLLSIQPASGAVADLEQILDGYLHDPCASEPVEFFHSVLASLLRDAAPNLWTILGCDPGLFPRIADGGSAEEPESPVYPNDFVAQRLAGIVASGGECADCAYRNWCAGFFKWPDPSYDCSSVKRLLGRIDETARELRRDLTEMETFEYDRQAV
jgi:hypothetical protein